MLRKQQARQRDAIWGHIPFIAFCAKVCVAGPWGKAALYTQHLPSRRSEPPLLASLLGYEAQRLKMRQLP